MKSLILLMIALVSGYTLLAQEEGTCADFKARSMLSIQKKKRAGTYDNSLMSKYDVHHYYLDLNIERNSTMISGFATIGATVTAASLDTFCFELNSMLTIDSIRLNSTTLVPFARVADITYALLPTQPLAAQVSLQIYYQGNASVVGGAAIGNGFSTGTSPSWGNQVTWSLSEPYSAKEWFPCKQFLQDKADSAWIFVTTNNQNKVGSNGVLEGVDSLPGNKVRFRWKTRYAIDYYLLSVAVAKYVDYTSWFKPSALPNDSVKLVNYVYDNPNTLPTFQAQIDSNALVMEYFSDLFGLYPFYEEKYGHSMAPFGGGMEHQTMTSVGNLGNFSLNAHESMHQWFGDYVTCKTWKDIFINEGFASYGEYIAYDHFRGWPAAQAKMLEVHTNVLQDINARVYFTDTTDVNRIFSKRLTYDKGSAVVHTLRFVLGDSLFYSGLKHFLQQYAFLTAGIDDLKNSLESHTGINLQDYFDQWLYGYGHPIFSGEFFANGNNLYLRVSHTGSSSGTTLFKGPLEIKCIGPAGDTTIRVTLTQNQNDFIIPYNRAVTNIEFDPNNWLLNTSGSIIDNPNLVTLDANYIQWNNQITVSPNPTTHTLTIHNPNLTIRHSTICDVSGKQLLQSKESDLNLSTLPAGIYLLSIHTEQGVFRRKIIKE